MCHSCVCVTYNWLSLGSNMWKVRQQPHVTGMLGEPCDKVRQLSYSFTSGGYQVNVNRNCTQVCSSTQLHMCALVTTYFLSLPHSTVIARIIFTITASTFSFHIVTYPIRSPCSRFVNCHFISFFKDNRGLKAAVIVVFIYTCYYPQLLYKVCKQGLFIIIHIWLQSMRWVHRECVHIPHVWVHSLTPGIINRSVDRAIYLPPLFNDPSILRCRYHQHLIHLVITHWPIRHKMAHR